MAFNMRDGKRCIPVRAIATLDVRIGVDEGDALESVASFDDWHVLFVSGQQLSEKAQGVTKRTWGLPKNCVKYSWMMGVQIL
jgi:hypothetical protein